ncbi:predicted protein [Lichtheimia corymbifera JMRC:FSU:9682]|uniref:Uncharacterized protein n=1 Tax=Lichtheimia corymbifera JMRC:FSU:9682 TaxID=1263082 RepID=A0A068S4P4_9FUNG|nr:predicted protein [Lichtheimia corymbifera JMRC:FSU:9682]
MCVPPPGGPGETQPFHHIWLAVIVINARGRRDILDVDEFGITPACFQIISVVDGHNNVLCRRRRLCMISNSLLATCTGSLIARWL